MGLIDNVQSEILQRMEARIVLKEPIELDELNALMLERWDKQKYGGFKLKKLFSIKWIDFDDYYMMHYSIQISNPTTQERDENNLKNNVVHISMKQAQKGYGSLKKEQKEQIDAVVSGKNFLDREKLRQFELEHLKLLSEAMRELLNGNGDLRQWSI
ncbi:MAG: hypothetical protein FWG43_02035 [Clostridiales bacterium]|nr:hypothetical protein [Clostridiales bacterium]